MPIRATIARRLQRSAAEPSHTAALAKPLGLTGVTLGTAIPNIAFAIVVLVAACRALEISVVDYLAYVVPRATAGAVPALALLLWFRLGIGVETFTDMAVAGSAMVVLFGKDIPGGVAVTVRAQQVSNVGLVRHQARGVEKMWESSRCINGHTRPATARSIPL